MRPAHTFNPLTGGVLHEWKLKAMKAEKTTGAKIARWNAGEDYARVLDAQNEGIQAKHATLDAERYIVAIGEAGSDTVFVSQDGGQTLLPAQAIGFDTYGDALKWTVENCEITSLECPIPRGYERPRFPRVCYLRVFSEVEPL